MTERMTLGEWVRFVLVMLFLLAAFGLAGEADYQDRTQGIGYDMMPDEGWAEAVRRG